MSVWYQRLVSSSKIIFEKSFEINSIKTTQNFEKLSENPFITCEFVQKFPRFPWNWLKLCKNLTEMTNDIHTNPNVETYWEWWLKNIFRNIPRNRDCYNTCCDMDVSYYSNIGFLDILASSKREITLEKVIETVKLFEPMKTNRDLRVGYTITHQNDF